MYELVAAGAGLHGDPCRLTGIPACSMQVGDGSWFTLGDVCGGEVQ